MNYSQLEDNGTTMENGTVPMDQQKNGLIGEIMNNGTVRMEQ